MTHTFLCSFGLIFLSAVVLFHFNNTPNQSPSVHRATLPKIGTFAPSSVLLASVFFTCFIDVFWLKD